MTTLTPDRRNPAAYISSARSNDAYNRSWRAIFVPIQDEMPECQKTTGRLVENAVEVEILKNRIPTSTCKSLRKKRFGFRTFSTSPPIDHALKEKEGNADNAAEKPVLI